MFIEYPSPDGLLYDTTSGPYGDYDDPGDPERPIFATFVPRDRPFGLPINRGMTNQPLLNCDHTMTSQTHTLRDLSPNRGTLGLQAVSALEKLIGHKLSKPELQGVTQCLIDATILPVNFLVGVKRRRMDLERKLNESSDIIIRALNESHIRNGVLRAYVVSLHGRGMPMI